MKNIKLRKVMAIVITCLLFSTSIFAEDGMSESVEITESVITLPDTTLDGQVVTTICGRTVMNLLGEDGECDDIDVIENYGRCTNEVEDEGFKHTITTDTGNAWVRFGKYDIDTSKYYLIRVDIDNDTGATISMRLVTSDGTIGINGDQIQSVATGETGTVISKFSPSNLENIDDETCRVDIYSTSPGEIDEVFYSDNWMLCEISEDDYNNLTADELLEKYRYVINEQDSTNLRIKSLGANLLSDNIIYNMSNSDCSDGKITLGEDNSLIFTSDDDEGWTKTVNGSMLSNDNKQYAMSINPSSTLYYSREIEGITDGTTDEHIFFYDMNYNFIEYTNCDSDNGSIKDTIEVPENAYYMTFRVGANEADQTVTFSNIMLSYYDLDYEAYKESVAYIPYTLNEDEEIVIDNLIAYENGTVIIDGIVKEQAIYEDDGIIINDVSLPIDYIESIYKIEGRKRTLVNLSEVTFTEYTLEIDDADYGDTYEYTYVYEKGLTVTPTLTYLVPTDDESVEEGTLNLVDNNAKDIEELYALVELLQQQLGTINTKPIEITCEVGTQYSVVLTGVNSINTSSHTFYVYYDPDKLQVIDLCGETASTELSTGVVSDTDITITVFDEDEGKIEFKVNYSSDEMAFSGVVNTVKFEGLVDDDTTSVTYTVE